METREPAAAAGETEVEKFGARSGQHDVARLQIPMNDALPMRFIQGIGDLFGVQQCLCNRQGTFAKAIGQGFTFNELHNKECHAVLLANVEGANVRMVQIRNCSGFAFESFFQIGAIRQMGGQDFDRDSAVEPRILSTIDFTHTACANGCEDFIRSEPGAGLDRHARRF